MLETHSSYFLPESAEVEFFSSVGWWDEPSWWQTWGDHRAVKGNDAAGVRLGGGDCHQCSRAQSSTIHEQCSISVTINCTYLKCQRRMHSSCLWHTQLYILRIPGWNIQNLSKLSSKCQSPGKHFLISSGRKQTHTATDKNKFNKVSREPWCCW